MHIPWVTKMWPVQGAFGWGQTASRGWGCSAPMLGSPRAGSRGSASNLALAQPSLRLWQGRLLRTRAPARCRTGHTGPSAALGRARPEQAALCTASRAGSPPEAPSSKVSEPVCRHRTSSSLPKLSIVLHLLCSSIPRPAFCKIRCNFWGSKESQYWESTAEDWSSPHPLVFLRVWDIPAMHSKSIL